VSRRAEGLGYITEFSQSSVAPVSGAKLGITPIIRASSQRKAAKPQARQPTIQVTGHAYSAEDGYEALRPDFD
jgi:hypothetical protein